MKDKPKTREFHCMDCGAIFTAQMPTTRRYCGDCTVRRISDATKRPRPS